MDFVPADPLKEYLGLTKAQSEKLDMYKKTIEKLRSSTFALPQFSKLKLTDAQIKKIAAGSEPRSVLTSEQKSVWDANQRQQGGPGGFGGPGQGGPGGFGGPGQGGPGQGGPGGFGGPGQGGPGGFGGPGQGGPGGFGGPGQGGPGQGGPEGGPRI
jgi:hypothetical protein